MTIAELATEAVILSALRYGETSKIVRLATRDHGVVSAIAKGALRPRSRFGASLQVLSRGEARLLPPRSGELYQLTGFDLMHLPVPIGASVSRYTAALALAEVVQRFAPADAHPEVFETLRAGLDDLETAVPEAIGPVALRAIWRVVGLLGFEPALEACVLDGVALPEEGPLPFSVREGGALCAACARTHAMRLLPPEDRAALAALLHADGPPPALEARHERAHRRLLSQFIHHQLAEGHPLPALAVWQGQQWERVP